MSDEPIPLRTRISLWGRSGGRCAIQECRCPLVETVEEAIDPSNVGDICHIVGRNGPRADPNFPAELLNSFGNLLVLCKIHHKIVDDHPKTYPVDELRKIKQAHEQWVNENLSNEQKAELEIKEQYAGILADWETMAEIPRWDHWANLIAHLYPQIFVSDADKFQKLEVWTNTRWWPHKLPVLEAAFLNYVKWLRLVQHVLYRHARQQDDMYFTAKYYQNANNKEEYDELFEHWDIHIKLLEKLMIELCKAANLIAVLARKHIAPAYRQAEGKFALYDTFTNADTVFSGVFEYRAAEIGDGLVYQRSDLYKRVMAQEL
jgi:hypothetical protein